MSSSQLFNLANKLKQYNIFIDDISLIKESIISAEVSYKNYTPVVSARVIFNDLYDMNLLRTWRDVEVTISYIDVFEELVSKSFVIMNVTEQYTDGNKKLFVLDLQDKFSFLLSNSFLSKGFKTNPIDALKHYISHLSLTDSLDISNESISDYNFCVPSCISNLDFFINEFNKFGFSFYQTKSSVVVKSLSELELSKLPRNGLFLNETDNQLYKNKILGLKSSLNNRSDILPKTRSLSYDFESKSMKYITDNSNDKYNLNSDSFNLQTTLGYRDIVQQIESENKHSLLLKESYLKQSVIEMVTNGYASNDINQIYELKLRGNISTSDSQSKGNLIMNGFYVSKSVTDKIVGDSLIQKIELQRSDLTSRG